MNYFVSILGCAALFACGGGGTAATTADSSSSAATSTSTSGVAGTTTGTAANSSAVTQPVVVAPGNVAGSATITNVKIQNMNSNQAPGSIPVTFGQVFAPGDLPDPSKLVGQLADGTAVALQVDTKARHPDGSVRHAVITTVLPAMTGSQTAVLSLNRATTSTTPAAGIGPAALLANGFTSSVNVIINGQIYSASADALLRTGKYTTWLSGPFVNEWMVSAPLTTAAGAAHPHLSARFAIRSYGTIGNTRVDVTVENDWAYQPAPQNFTYDFNVLVNNNAKFTGAALTHYHHARWRKTLWTGSTPSINIQHNTAYLIASKAVPNYDQSVVIAPVNLAAISSQFSGPVTQIMAVGMAQPYMPNTGGRPDLGLMPGWAAAYLLSMDAGAKNATLGTADLAGSWSVHYRDANTDKPVSLMNYPYMTILGNPGDTVDPATKKSEAFPSCGGDCTTPNTADDAHEPNFAYLPYLVTGDYYYLEELEFWTMWNLFQSNPGYRANIQGLFHSNQVRAQAWVLRTLAEAAYITPDTDAFKSQFATFLSNNLDWYNATYTNNPIPDNALGALTRDSAIGYGNNTGIAPWMDDFFTSAVGHTVELGFAKAQPLLAWKVKFPIGRMVDPGFCWIEGAVYALNIRDTATSPIYTSFGQAYLASVPANVAAAACGSGTMANLLGLKVGEMTGYANVETGFPSNMQPALAYSSDSGVTGGAAAWKVFAARSVKPNYSNGPQFAIVPRY